MILSFKVENFRSFKKAQTFSLICSDDNDNHKTNYFKPEKENISILKSSIIFGPNASGKSNLIKAVNAMKNLIIRSTDLKLEENIPVYDPFKFDLKYSEKPVIFEISFIPKDKIRYCYTVAFIQKSIICEKLFYYPKGQKTRLFERRKGLPMKWGSHLIGKKKSLEAELLENNLFLSKAANSNHPQLKQIYLYFKDNFHFYIVPFSVEPQTSYTTNELLKKNNQVFKDKLSKFISAADFGIHSVGVKKIDNKDVIPSEFLKNFPKEIVNDIIESFSNIPITFHNRYKDEKQFDTTPLDLSDESAGTQKMYEIAGLIINVLENGKTLFIDELDSSFHPTLSKYIISLFNDLETNPCNSQIVCISNNTSILDQNMFRRDQIWFSEKSKFGETELFCLDDFKRSEVRKSAPFEKWYLDGRFGALPLIDFRKIFIEKQKELFKSECNE